MAFIAFNYPGTPTPQQITAFEAETCSAPIVGIFGAQITAQHYIRHQVYGNSYGLIIACNLADVVLPEMKYVRENIIKHGSYNLLEAPSV